MPNAQCAQCPMPNASFVPQVPRSQPARFARVLVAHVVLSFSGALSQCASYYAIAMSACNIDTGHVMVPATRP